MKRLPAISLVLAHACVLANPSSPAVKAGSAAFHENGKNLQITTSDRAIIEWKDFSIHPSELTKFIQPSKHSAVLNRVTGIDPSSLLGTLQANGKVFLINSNGILIGPSGLIDVASFFASTFDIHNEDFLQNRTLLFQGDSQASIVNYGTIKAWDGNVSLVSCSIENHGQISASNVALGGKEEILLQPEGDFAFIRPKGDISSLEQEGNPYLLGINHKGKIEAAKITQKDGRVYLGAKNIEVSGEITSSEGDVQILGENIILTSTSHIDTNSSQKGNGGDVIVSAGKIGAFYGSIEARGGEEGGDGGFVEVSGKQHLDFRGTADRSAPKGQAGMLLLDPSDIDIFNNGGVNSANIAFGGGCGASTYCVVGGVPNPAILDNNVLGGALAGGPVTVTTAFGSAGLGTIRILDIVTWSSGNTLTLVSDENIEVDASILNQPAGLVATGTGGITLTVGGAGSGDLILKGGAVVNAYATISSDLGPILVTTVHNVSITGGTAAQTYAQIGRGSLAVPPTGSTFNASISMAMIRENVSLQGGSAAGAYAQIGHSPFTGAASLTVGGDVTVIATGGINTISLQGGMGTQATAIIGHGNELTSFVGDCSGNITVHSDLGITLLGAAADYSHAIIGFHSPSSIAPMANFTCTSDNSIDVQTIAFDSVTLTANTGSNATIGYYNANVAAASPITVQINGGNQISVQTTINGNVTLNAGSTNGIGAGAAVIGTFVSNTPGNTAESVISINTNGLNLYGPALLADDGAALVVNNDYINQLSTTTDDITITMSLTNDVNVLGGTGAATGLAEIYSSHNLNLNIFGNLNVNKALALQNAPARVVADNQLYLQGLFTSDVFLYGGTNLTAEALMECTNGPVLFGMLLMTGARNVKVGEPSGASLAPSRILAKNNNTIFQLAGSIDLQAGSGVNATSEIKSDVGTLYFEYLGALTLNGGSAASAYAEISSIGGNITMVSGSGDVILRGGTADKTYAQIGKGFLSAPTAMITSNIHWLELAHALRLTGGSGTDSYAQVGHAPFGAAGTTDVIGDIIFTGFSIGSVTLAGGTNTNATAIIGHGNEVTTSTLKNCTGEISFNSVTDINMTAGSVPQTHAVIGFHSPTLSSPGPLNVNSSLIHITYGQNFNLTATNGSNAIVGYYNSTTAPGINVSIGNIQIISHKPAIEGILNLQPGNNGGTGAGQAVIGTYVAPGSTAHSSINQINVQHVNLLSPLGGNDGQALIANYGFAGGPVHIRAHQNIYMARNSLIFNAGPRGLLAIADHDIYMTQNATALADQGNLTLVVDNAFPKSPGIGKGKMVKEFSASIGSVGGKVRIFTAERPLNKIQGFINGTLYIPGPLYINSPTEVWKTYYPSSFGGVPFTIFYKDPTGVPPSIIITAMVASSEMFYDLGVYDELFFHPWDVTVSYDQSKFKLQPKLEGGLSTFETVSEQSYPIMRRLYRELHLKKIDTLK